MATELTVSGLSTDLRNGLAFLTRLPTAPATAVSGADVARASWTFPIIGAGIGLIGALAFWFAHALGLHAFVSATIAIAATLLVTGCLHEDGLADTADGFGGGATPERKLEIMRDSRIGTYGVAALSVSLLLRIGAIASLATPALVAPALIAAHAGARATMPIFMRAVPHARPDGLSAGAGVPPQGTTPLAILIGLILLLIFLGFSATLLSVLLLAAALGFMAWLSLREIGGQTGDVLGAVEQVCEVVLLLLAAALL